MGEYSELLQPEAVDENQFDRRNVRSLCSRFDNIASSCTLFWASHTQVKARNQSCGNAESMFAETKELYIIKEPKNQPFKFDHACKILKFHVKWAEPVGPNITSSPLGDSASSPLGDSSSSHFGHSGSQERLKEGKERRQKKTREGKRSYVARDDEQRWKEPRSYAKAT